MGLGAYDNDGYLDLVVTSYDRLAPHYAGFQADSPAIANSICHALQVRAGRGFSNGLQFLPTYTWSKSIR